MHRYHIASALLALVLTAAVALSSAAAPPLLDPSTQPRFVNPLPIPARIDATRVPKEEKRDRRDEPEKVSKRTPRFVVDMRETHQWLGLVAPDGSPMPTTVWGYGLAGGPVTYPGPTFVAMKNRPVDILWRNELPPYNMGFPGVGGHLLPVDPTLHMAHPAGGGIPTVTHLHGGHTESASDGLPEAWFTQGFADTGPHFVKRLYHYDNDQEAATLWYHDHALGITRLNVYAGLAGFYLLRDKNENKLLRKHVLPGDEHEIEIVVQDRMFTADGELFFPSEDPEIEPGFDPLPPGPSAIAEFFGDFILVNGMAWPKLDVEPEPYRFRLLNGSDSRFYVLELRDDPLAGVAQPFLQIGTDNGLLPRAQTMTRLLLAPGERADVVVDFAAFAPGTELFVRNFGPDEPFKGFNPDGTLSDGAGGALPPADPATTGTLMKFVVGNADLDDDDDDDIATVQDGTRLRDDIKPLELDGAVRNLVLFEGLDNYGRLQPLLGTLQDGSLAWFQPITENPMKNDVEIWEVYNATEDAHPIHLHLVSFQVLNRESFSGFVTERPQEQHDGTFGVGGDLTVTALGGDVVPPEPHERGWKDTVVMMPGQVTRIIARFDREGRYVWHCHILSHEDHEMMRPFHVGPLPMGPVAQEMPIAGTIDPRLGANVPNPFNPSTRIEFALPAAARVRLEVFDVAGRRVRTLFAGWAEAGPHAITWDGRDARGRAAASGVYYYRLDTGTVSMTRKMLLAK